jgi:NAD(P)-dependent dehydrogenase (short-subunit alcohol dehydrogenase family)
VFGVDLDRGAAAAPRGIIAAEGGVCATHAADVSKAGSVAAMVEACLAAFGVRTSQCPMGHMGTGWDTAHAVLFLASDEARYVTGIDLIVDSGLTATFA